MDLKQVNAVSKWKNPLAAGIAPRDTTLSDAIKARMDSQLERLAEDIKWNIAQGTKPTQETIVVPSDVPFEDMFWKCEDGAIRRIIECEKPQCLKIIKDLTIKINSLQNALSSQDQKREVPKVYFDTFKDAKDREEKALSLLK